MHRTELTETIHGCGHENILATHHATFEFTKDNHVSRDGDCILVVSCDKSLLDLGKQFKEALRQPHSRLTVRIEADGMSEEAHAEGSSSLSLSHPREMVVRKSDYVSDRTLAVHADKAARDFSRALVEQLKNPRQQVVVTLVVRV
ncbi:MAG: DUF371 domain-containing protein [Candidatus Bathyarchaeia archaeon]